MKNKKGFVLIETIVVICVLTLGLVSLYGSYVLIIKKTNSSDSINPSNFYIAYQIDKYNFNQTNETELYKEIYLNRQDKKYYSRTYNDYNNPVEITSAEQKDLYSNLNIDKIYYIYNIDDLFQNNNQILLSLDGSTINYINSIRNDTSVKPGKMTIIKIKTNDNKSEFSFYQGNEEKYSVINSIEDLVRLSSSVNNGNFKKGTYVILNTNLNFNNNANYENINGTTFGDLNNDGTISGIKTELTSTTGRGFTPIGNNTNPFEGEFFGNNHKIENIYINNNVSGELLGFFGAIKDSKIRNLTITGTIKSGENIINTTGGIVGVVKGKSQVFKCSNQIAITTLDSTSCVGGIVGYLDAGEENELEIIDSSSTKQITNGLTTGGIIGLVKENSKLLIKNSTNSGKVINNLGTSAAGIIGKNEGNTIIEGCNNTVDIVTTSLRDTVFNEGGIVGNNEGTLLIKSSGNTGTISTNYDTSNNIAIGGLVGKNSGNLEIISSNNRYVDGSHKGEIKNLKAITEKEGIDNLNIIVGGLVGWSTSRTTISNSYNTGAILGGNLVGGIIGYVSNNSQNIINNCYNTGAVTTTTNIMGQTNYPGGIIGGTYSATYTILNTYNKAEISNSYGSASCFVGLSGEDTNGYILNSYNHGSTKNNCTNSYGFINANSPAAKVTLFNIYGYGSGLKAKSGGSKYVIGYLDPESTVNADRVFYCTGYAPSNQSIGTQLTVENFKDSDNINTAIDQNNSLAIQLNNNINNIKPKDINSNLPDDLTYREWVNITPGTSYPVFK